MARSAAAVRDVREANQLALSARSVAEKGRRGGAASRPLDVDVDVGGDGDVHDHRQSKTSRDAHKGRR
jgi:hypothetical protein